MIRWLPLLAALCLAPSATAAETLTLDRALDEALARNPALATSRLQVDAAEGGLMAARAAFDPQLRIQGEVRSEESNQLFGGLVFDQSSLRTSASSSITGELPTGTGYSVVGTYNQNDQEAPDFRTGQVTETVRQAPGVTATLSQEVLRGHRTAFNRRRVLEARNAMDVAQLQVEAQAQRTLAEVTQAYWNWVHQEALVDIAEQRTELAKENLRIGELQLEEGRVAPVEVTRLRAAAVRARTSLLDARQAAARTADGLLLLLGRTPGEAVSPGTPLSDVPGGFDLDVEQAVEVALEGNLDLAVDQLEAEQADLSTRLARHGQLPSLTLDGTLGLTQVTNKIDGDQQEPLPNRTLAAGATFSVPLGNRAARGEVMQAAATEAQRDRELEQRRQQVARDVAEQVRALEAATEQVRLADLELDLAKETLAAEEARQAAGRAVLTDVLEARAERFDAEARLARARVDAQLAAVELLRLQGRLGVDRLAAAAR
jgi:outer membrane protein TolC